MPDTYPEEVIQAYIDSFDELEKISYERSPLLVCSTTIGIKELI